MSSSKMRFDLYSILEAMAAIAFVSALMASGAGRGAWTFTFAGLPPDDTALLAWLDERDKYDVTVSRDGDQLIIAWSMSVWAAVRHDAYTMPDMPWEQLGYSGLKSMRYSSQWSMFGGSAWLWFSGLGVLIALHLGRKRYVDRRRSQDAAMPGPVAPSDS